MQGVIQYAATQPQKSGGSIFDRITRKIFVEARQLGKGNFRSQFSTTYNFQDFLFSLGDSTIAGYADVRAQEKKGFLSVSAEIYYTFWDEFKDPLDIYDLIPIDYEPGGGVPFTILDTWMVRLEAMIKIDSSKNIFQDDEFGTLSP